MLNLKNVRKDRRLTEELLDVMADIHALAVRLNRAAGRFESDGEATRRTLRARDGLDVIRREVFALAALAEQKRQALFTDDGEPRPIPAPKRKNARKAKLAKPRK